MRLCLGSVCPGNTDLADPLGWQIQTQNRYLRMVHGPEVDQCDGAATQRQKKLIKNMRWQLAVEDHDGSRLTNQPISCVETVFQRTEFFTIVRVHIRYKRRLSPIYKPHVNVRSLLFFFYIHDQDVLFMHIFTGIMSLILHESRFMIEAPLRALFHTNSSHVNIKGMAPSFCERTPPHRKPLLVPLQVWLRSSL